MVDSLDSKPANIPVSPMSASVTDKVLSWPMGKPDRESAAVGDRKAAKAEGASDKSRTALAARMASAPPVDAERVAQLRRAVATGNYALAPDKVADALLTLRQRWTAEP